VTTSILYRSKLLQIHSYVFREGDFVVGIVIRLRDEWFGFQIPIKHFSLPHNVQSVYGAHAATNSKGFTPEQSDLGIQITTDLHLVLRK
jgi:hypothetical protein